MQQKIQSSPILNEAQKFFLEIFSGSDIASDFVLSGGTALAAFHLGHRLSDDLDFFSTCRDMFRLRAFFGTGWKNTLAMLSTTG